MPMNLVLTATDDITRLVDELPGFETLITLGVCLLMATLVSLFRVLRERGIQRRANKPLSTITDIFADTMYGGLAGLAIVLATGAAVSLSFKPQVAMAMVAGALGPPAWDLIAKVINGQYKINLSAKEDDKRE